METPQEVVLRILEALGAEDFEKFNWHLQQEGALNDFPAIPKSKLERETRLNTVDMMLQTYSIKIIDLTRIVLVKMNQNDLVKKLPCHGEVNTPEREEIRAACQQILKSKLDRKVQRVFEGLLSRKPNRSGSIETEEAELSRFEEVLILFIFDGLDECRPPLDFFNTEVLTDVTKSTSAKRKNVKYDGGSETDRTWSPENSCELTFDTNTVSRKLKLSDNNRKVTRVKKDQPYPGYPERT
ncbi:uncharacterized protein LOC116678343 [Etheostoma spectabile]|uniref:uncharacterized protein LOC116678343 n=1 Tax=Etheostoma spectabile TaxID=54343 RepID=UPI0013AF5221|nr:uncharacterized protein LOC116678343 [Etheostoma spectabile]